MFFLSFFVSLSLVRAILQPAGEQYWNSSCSKSCASSRLLHYFSLSLAAPQWDIVVVVVVGNPIYILNIQARVKCLLLTNLPMQILERNIPSEHMTKDSILVHDESPLSLPHALSTISDRCHLIACERKTGQKKNDPPAMSFDAYTCEETLRSSPWSHVSYSLSSCIHTVSTSTRERERREKICLWCWQFPSPCNRTSSSHHCNNCHVYYAVHGRVVTSFRVRGVCVQANLEARKGKRGKRKRNTASARTHRGARIYAMQKRARGKRRLLN